MISTKNGLHAHIRRKLLGYDCVYVQMDSANAHVKVWGDIEKCATRIQMHGQKTPIIRFVKQPGKSSPDTNVLDFCFFRSLGKLVSKDEREFQQEYCGKEAFGSTSKRLQLSQKQRDHG